MRKKNWKKNVAVVLTIIMTATMTEGIQQVKADSKSIVIDGDVVKLNQREKKKYQHIADGLAEEIRKSNNADYSNIIREYTTNNDCSIQEKIVKEVAETINEEKDKNEVPKVIINEGFQEEFQESYIIDEKTQVTVNPFFIEVTTIENCGEKEKKVGFIDKILSYYIPKVQAATSTKTRQYSESQSYYSWVGLKMFTIGMDCNFYYNGEKAWYKSGFDAWYKRGTLSVWQVSNWKEKREKSGSSYVARCSGNFHMGLEVNGVGIVIEDHYIKHTVTCKKMEKYRLWKL